METKKKPLEIRFATPGDVPLILSFIKELAEYEKNTEEITATEEQLQRTLFGEKRAEVLIAEAGGVPAGIALFFHNFSTSLCKAGIYLEDLYVRPEWRGQGTGKALLSRLAQLVRERDCGRLEWACMNWNEPAIGFYRSLGARSQDDLMVFHLGEDDVETLAGCCH
jgi:GNAT superfamily N-acetyltransferase